MIEMELKYGQNSGLCHLILKNTEIIIFSNRNVPENLGFSLGVIISNDAVEYPGWSNMPLQLPNPVFIRFGT